MTKFEDGPAKGITLMLKRSPKFLRVVQDARTGDFDALDQPSDYPEEAETIFAYVLAKHLGNCHINRGRNGSGFYPICEYKFITNQPTQEVMRHSDHWSDWCDDQV